MSHTVRRALVYTFDNTFPNNRCGQSTAAGKVFAKRINRKRDRSEQRKITREANREFYAFAEMDMLDQIEMADLDDDARHEQDYLNDCDNCLWDEQDDISDDWY